MLTIFFLFRGRKRTSGLQLLAGKRVAIITENGFEEVELTSPLQALKDAGANAAE